VGRANPAVRSLSVVIRAKDEEEGIGRTLELLAAQDREAEVIVVDSGSTDATPQIARTSGARLIEIPAASFTFGGSLNTGCEAAEGEIVVALSAHAYPTDPAWLSRMTQAFDDDTVACACGQHYSYAGGVLDEPVRQDAALQRRHPEWGYTNAAGAFRADLWREKPWRTDMPATEDKEWSLHWMEQGYVTLIDPALTVEHSHAHDPLLDQYRRARREYEGFAMAFDLPPYGLRDLARDWWNDLGSYDSALKARLSHRRAIRLAGAYSGRRRGTGA
jgi:rhamnosyltransferase